VAQIGEATVAVDGEGGIVGGCCDWSCPTCTCDGRDIEVE
jgi:hypothetical protein